MPQTLYENMKTHFNKLHCRRATKLPLKSVHQEKSLQKNGVNNSYRKFTIHKQNSPLWIRVIRDIISEIGNIITTKIVNKKLFGNRMYYSQQP